jgi:hypothetical protein
MFDEYEDGKPFISALALPWLNYTLFSTPMTDVWLARSVICQEHIHYTSLYTR